MDIRILETHSFMPKLMIWRFLPVFPGRVEAQICIGSYLTLGTTDEPEVVII